MGIKKEVLYLSYNGVLEPIGSSQVLGYLYELSRDYTIYLVSLEKPEDYFSEDYQELKTRLKSEGIRWFPIVYRTSSIGKKINFLNFTSKTFEVVRKFNLRNIHCRSYVTAVTAFVIKKFIPIKYIFDTRNFAFDERADVGTLNRQGSLYKLGKKLEKQLYKKADAVIILSRKGKQTVLRNELFPGGSEIKDIEIIPTCVNLERFRFPERNFSSEKMTIGYVGTAVGWYDFEKTAATLAAMKDDLDFNLVIFNNNQYEQHDFIKKKLSEYGIMPEEYSLEKVSFSEMPRRLEEIDLALFYIHPYFSKRASAATKLGELLASGIPVVTNKDVGDHEFYIRNYKVGEIIEFEKLQSYDFKTLLEPLFNYETSLRCREVAEKYFSLDKGVNNYKEVYERTFL